MALLFVMQLSCLNVAGWLVCPRYPFIACMHACAVPHPHPHPTPHTHLQDSATSAPSDSLRSSVSLATTAATATPPYAQSTNGEVDAAGFVALMESVVARTKGEQWAALSCCVICHSRCVYWEGMGGSSSGAGCAVFRSRGFLLSIHTRLTHPHLLPICRPHPPVPVALALGAPEV